MNNIIENVENAAIRVDTATQKGSVLDVIRMVLGCDASSANTAFRRLKEDVPEFAAELAVVCHQLSTLNTGIETCAENAMDVKKLEKKRKFIGMDTILDEVGFTNVGNIRVDTATQKGSVLDVIRMVLGCESNSANTAFRRLKDDFSGLACSQIRINRKGKLTPVADAKTLVEVIMLLPGKTSARFRWYSAGIVCRVIGGDMKLLEEIKENDQKWKSLERGSLVQKALLRTREYRETLGAKKSRRVLEQFVRNDLALAVGGKIEVETPAGFIDVLSPSEVIEVKYYRKWKHGLGQVLAYHSYYPHLTKRLHLFAHDKDVDTSEILELALSVCKTHDVDVTF